MSVEYADWLHIPYLYHLKVEVLIGCGRAGKCCRRRSGSCMNWQRTSSPPRLGLPRFTKICSIGDWLGMVTVV